MGSTALHRALFENAPASIVKLLLDSGADFNAGNRFGDTGLDAYLESDRDPEVLRVIFKHITV